MKIRTVFFGSGYFAVKILQGILQMPLLDVVAVVTQPDKPAGRKQQLTACPVMQELIDTGSNIPVFKPVKLRKEAEQILADTQPEFILVADYGQIIPASIIDYPKYKCLNVHGSLLPDLRGAVPAQMAILKGYTQTGVSIPVMTPGLDDGAVVASKQEDIKPEDTAYSLRMRLADVGIDLLNEVLPLWFDGKIEAVEQNHDKATSTWQSDIAKEKAQITKDTDVNLAERMIRAFNPWPIAWVEASINGKPKRIKLFKAVIDTDISGDVGGFVKINKQLYLALKGGVLKVEQLQVEGKPIMQGRDALFLSGTNIF